MKVKLSDKILGKPFDRWPLGTMLGKLVRAGEDGALAVGQQGDGYPYEAQGAAVQVGAIFSDPALRKKGRCPVCREPLQRVAATYGQKNRDHLFRDHPRSMDGHAMATVPLLEVLRRIGKGERLDQLAAPVDHLSINAVARLGDLVVGLTDSRGLLAAAALTTPRFGPSSKPATGRARATTKSVTEMSKRTWSGDRVELKAVTRAKEKPSPAGEDLRTMFAEIAVMDLDSQGERTKHTRQKPRGRTDIQWHGWKVLRGDEVRFQHLPRWPSYLDERLLLDRAKEIDVWPDRDPLTSRKDHQHRQPGRSLDIDTEQALHRLLEADDRKILEGKVQDLASKEIALRLGPPFTAAKVDKKWQTITTRLRKAKLAGFRLPG